MAILMTQIILRLTYRFMGDGSGLKDYGICRRRDRAISYVRKCLYSIQARSNFPSRHRVIASSAISPRSQPDKSTLTGCSSEMKSFVGSSGERVILATTPDRCTAVREIVSRVHSERQYSLSLSMILLDPGCCPSSLRITVWQTSK